MRLLVRKSSIPQVLRKGMADVGPVRYGCMQGWEMSMEGDINDLMGKPVFFDWQQLEVFFDPMPNTGYSPPFQLYLNRQPTEFRSFPGLDQSQLFGSLSLANAIGYTDLEIKDDSGKEVWSFQTEIFPLKLNYKSDFEEMVEDLTDEIYNLTYDLLKKTFIMTDPVLVDRVSGLEWLAMFESLFETLENRLMIVLAQPHSRVMRTGAARPIEKVKRPHPHTLRWLVKKPGYLSATNVDDPFQIRRGVRSTHLLELQKHISYDTFENRFLAWMLRGLFLQLEQLSTTFANSSISDVKKQTVISQIGKWKERLRAHLQQALFQRVGAFYMQQGLSTVLNRAAGYREIYQIYLLLKKGLSIASEEIFRIDYKEISVLYEYWCYLSVIKYFRQHKSYRLEEQNLVKVSGDRLFVRLKKGEDSRVVFKGKNDGSRVIVWYNRIFSAKETGTLRQIPDILIEFYKTDYHTPFRYILDAKYQLDLPGNPPKEAIAQLHRYRDVILSQKVRGPSYTSALKSLGGVILFPFPFEEEDFVGHKMYRSLTSIQIGAIPLHPGKGRKHRLFYKHMDRLLDSSPEALNEQMVEYEKRDHKRMIARTQERVLIGQIPDDLWYIQKKQFVWENQIFFLPALRNEVNIAKVALYDRRNQRLVAYADVVEKENLTERQLIALGVNWPLRYRVKKYLLYHCSAWNPCFLSLRDLANKVYYTNSWGLEQAIRHEESLYLWLPDYPWIRAWQEISRVDPKAHLVRENFPEIEIHFFWKERDWVCRKDEGRLVIENAGKKIPFNPDFDMISF